MKKNYQYENSRGTPSDAKYSVYKFQKNPCSHLLEHAWTNSCPQTAVRQTDGQSNGRDETNIPRNFVCGGITMVEERVSLP